MFCQRAGGQTKKNDFLPSLLQILFEKHVGYPMGIGWALNFASLTPDEEKKTTANPSGSRIVFRWIRLRFCEKHFPSETVVSSISQEGKQQQEGCLWL